MERLEDRHVISHSGKVARTGQSRGAGADHGYLFAQLFLCSFGGNSVLPCPVRSKTLQLADGNRFALNTPDTFALALALLRADTSADCRQGGRTADYLICLFHIAALHLLDKARNIDRHRAPFNTLGIFTVNASGSLFHCLFHIIAQTYFLKVCCSLFCILFSDRHLF